MDIGITLGGAAGYVLEKIGEACPKLTAGLAAIGTAIVAAGCAYTVYAKKGTKLKKEELQKAINESDKINDQVVAVAKNSVKG